MRYLFVLPLLAAPAFAQTAEQGKAVYDAHCTFCHGANGTAGARAPAIVADGGQSEAQLLDIVRSGIPGSAMPAWKGRLTDAEIAAIGAYIHLLRAPAQKAPPARHRRKAAVNP
jgi:mono/diheme cytochrome c family protein